MCALIVLTKRRPKMIVAQNGSIFLSATFSLRKKKVIAKTASENVLCMHYLSLPSPTPSFCIPFKSWSIVKGIFFFSKDLGIIVAVWNRLKIAFPLKKLQSMNKHPGQTFYSCVTLLCLPCKLQRFALDAFDFFFSKLDLLKSMVKGMWVYTTASYQQWEKGVHRLQYWIYGFTCLVNL